jgi:DNA-binding NarL/FixJ family response regulator
MEGSEPVIHVAVLNPPAAARAVRRARAMELSGLDEEPDVVVVDPDGEGLLVCSRLSAKGARVLVYAPDADEAVTLGAGVAGALGVVTDPSELLEAIRRIERSLAAPV